MCRYRDHPYGEPLPGDSGAVTLRTGVVPIAVERGESDGSGFTMLRDLALQVWSGFDVARERGIEALHVTEATHGAKAAGCFV